MIVIVSAWSDEAVDDVLIVLSQYRTSGTESKLL